MGKRFIKTSLKKTRIELSDKNMHLIQMKDEHDNRIFIPDQSNIFQEALDEGIDLHEAVGSDD